MTNERSWLPAGAQARERAITDSISTAGFDEIDALIHSLSDENREIHEQHCINLNPATNIMNPRAEALLSTGLGSRPSLGYPGEKYEMGLEAIEQIEVVAADLACRVFDATYAEIRVGSGALANLYSFMATCEPGDAIIVPPASIGGHVTHNTAGAAGLYRLDIHEAPIDPTTYTVDVEGVKALAASVKPKLITIGSSLNLTPHPVAELRAIADDVGAHLLFDAAHLCGMIAGRTWANPLDDGAHLMTMSTYKSLGGPAGGLLVTRDAALAERIDAIAYPGLTANFDVAKSAALAITMLDWLEHGPAYAQAMVDNASTLAAELIRCDIPVFMPGDHEVTSHQFAVDTSQWGGGHTAAIRLREANLLTCAIGLPSGDGDGLRFGTPEVTRIGMGPSDMIDIADCIADALKGDPNLSAGRVSSIRAKFTELQYVRSLSTS